MQLFSKIQKMAVINKHIILDLQQDYHPQVIQ